MITIYVYYFPLLALEFIPCIPVEVEAHLAYFHMLPLGLPTFYTQNIFYRPYIPYKGMEGMLDQLDQLDM